MKELEPFVGKWTIDARFEAMPPDAPKGRVTFEFMEGGEFLVERWEVPVPEAPDGIAIIGPNPEGDGYLQHYFDTRGVARVYEMEFDGRVWKLERLTEDFSPLDFKQRYSGTFSDDGRTIDGAWDICHPGKDWEKDFDLIYERLD